MKKIKRILNVSKMLLLVGLSSFILVSCGNTKESILIYSAGEDYKIATAEELYKLVIIQQEEDAKVQEYAQAYAEMKPKEAAGIIEAMTNDLELAARILWQMTAEDRGKILGVMDADVAAKLTKIMDPES